MSRVYHQQESDLSRSVQRFIKIVWQIVTVIGTVNPSLTGDLEGLNGEENGQALLWERPCTVHLCMVPSRGPDSVSPLQDTGQDSKVCLSVILNNHNKGDLVYVCKNSTWHECRQKAGHRWRSFVLKFDTSNQEAFDGYQSTIQEILRTIDSSDVPDTTYILVAISSKDNRVPVETSAIEVDTKPSTLPKKLSVRPVVPPKPTRPRPLSDKTGNKPPKHTSNILIEDKKSSWNFLRKAFKQKLKKGTKDTKKDGLSTGGSSQSLDIHEAGDESINVEIKNKKSELDSSKKAEISRTRNEYVAFEIKYDKCPLNRSETKDKSKNVVRGILVSEAKSDRCSTGSSSGTVESSQIDDDERNVRNDPSSCVDQSHIEKDSVQLGKDSSKVGIKFDARSSGSSVETVEIPELPDRKHVYEDIEYGIPPGKVDSAVVNSALAVVDIAETIGISEAEKFPVDIEKEDIYKYTEEQLFGEENNNLSEFSKLILNGEDVSVSEKVEPEQDQADVFAEDTKSENEFEIQAEEDRPTPCNQNLSAPFANLVAFEPYVPKNRFVIDQEGDKFSITYQCPENDEKVPVNFDEVCDSLNIHPDELPQSLNAVLNSVRSIRLRREPKLNPGDDYMNLGSVKQGETSEHLQSDDIYMDMNKMMEAQKHESLKFQDAKKLAMLLQTAINEQDVQNAERFAAELARERVHVEISVSMPRSNVVETDKYFNLKVHIEDKVSAAGSIIMKVKATDTIRDLKNKMLMKHFFPVEIQHWIVGKRIPPDTETLEKCRIRTDGHTAFLYLVSAKSVGLDREEFQRRQMAPNNPGVPMGGPMEQEIHGLAPPPPAVCHAGPANRQGSQPAGHGKQIKKETPTKGDNLNLQKKGQKPTPEKLPGGKGQGQMIQGPAGLPIGFDDANQRRKNTSADEIRHIMNAIAPQITKARQEVDRNPGLLGAAGPRVPMMHSDDEEQGWQCTACTLINQPTRPGCAACSHPRPTDYQVPEGYQMSEEETQRLRMEEILERQTRQAEEMELEEDLRRRQRNYANLQEADAQDVIPNTASFNCPICFDEIEIGEGVVLRECLHSFCRECLKNAVQYNEEPELKCPYQDDNYACEGLLQDREIRAVVTQEMYNKYLARSLATAESQAANSFHCKTADCPGWCLYEDHVNFFVCPVCQNENCLTCKAIHAGMNCKQYQEDIQIRARDDRAANQTQVMIRKMLADGEAMPCPQCQVIVMKKEGCDWIQCSICKTEICWVTKGPRWGPKGNGDISGGCQCRVDGQVCHPDCNNCH